MKCNSEKCLQMSASAVDSCGFFFFIFSIVYSNSAVHMNFPLFVCSAVSGHRGAVTHNTVTWFRHFVKCVLCVSIQCVCVSDSSTARRPLQDRLPHFFLFLCVPSLDCSSRPACESPTLQHRHHQQQWSLFWYQAEAVFTVVWLHCLLFKTRHQVGMWPCSESQSQVWTSSQGKCFLGITPRHGLYHVNQVSVCLIWVKIKKLIL